MPADNKGAESGERTIRVAIYLPESVDRAVEIEAAARNISKSQLISDAIETLIPESIREYREKGRR